ncbi:hypothetical protein PtA15_6A592 [Puccinia triticina]|uniref:Uncharacterized protein n=1 Tax=Puccinia triticina TaxID=208348 RepID=A0ABY7CTB8_9BASI|nr:uncharacterized protein PtA15_6A592 [Puccinia triticina]WAQ85962.1 hypothetical protein PtA15_6A592 [Puccinia triticina]
MSRRCRHNRKLCSPRLLDPSPVVLFNEEEAEPILALKPTHTDSMPAGPINSLQVQEDNQASMGNSPSDEPEGNVVLPKKRKYTKKAKPTSVESPVLNNDSTPIGE